MRLVGRGPPGAELLQREHQLDRVEQRDDAREPRRRQPAGQTDELGARDVDVDEPACDLLVGELRRLRGDVEVEAVARDEPVDDVEVLGAAAVHRHHPAVLDLEPRLRVVRPVHRDQPELRVGRDQDLAPELAPLARGEALRPPRAHPSPAGRAAAYAVAASRTNAAVSEAPELGLQPHGPRFQLLRRRAVRAERGVDLEDRLAGNVRELGRAREVVRELRSACGERDRRLAAERLGRRP